MMSIRRIGDAAGAESAILPMPGVDIGFRDVRNQHERDGRRIRSRRSERAELSEESEPVALVPLLGDPTVRQPVDDLCGERDARARRGSAE